MVRQVRKDFPRMGANKIRIHLQPKFKSLGIETGRDQFWALLCENNLLVRRLRNRRKTTFSCHWLRKYPNLIRDFTPTGTNQLWVSDITYIEVGYGFVYLSLITDAYSRKIVGWNTVRDLGADNALRALKGALKTLPGKVNLIHHSDRGIQYCSNNYVKLLHRHNISISMTESGDPLENAVAEKVNGILKTEWFYNHPLTSWKEAVKYTTSAIKLYNTQRPHQSISYLTPDNVHCNEIKVERKWKSYWQREQDRDNLSILQSEFVPDSFTQ